MFYDSSTQHKIDNPGDFMGFFRTRTNAHAHAQAVCKIAIQLAPQKLPHNFSCANKKNPRIFLTEIGLLLAPYCLHFVENLHSQN